MCCRGASAGIFADAGYLFTDSCDVEKHGLCDSGDLLRRGEKCSG